MIAYVGQTRSPKLVAELARLGVGECTQAGELPPRRRRWFHDTRAFADYMAGRAFNSGRWSRDMMRLRTDCERIAAGRPAPAPLSRRPGDQIVATLPDFVVVPDVVAGGAKSLELSAFWRDMVPVEVPAYLVVQNGMTEDDVGKHLDQHERDGLAYGGLFVGGDDEWKAATAPSWSTFAHGRALQLHVGRCGPARMVAWARDLGADSIDSSLPLMHADHLRAFLEALGLW